MRIEVEALSKTYQSRDAEDIIALKDVTIEPIENGSFVTLVGPSGCGKTTFLDIVTGVTKPSSGRLQMISETETSPRPGIVPQQPVLLDWRTNLENVLFPSELGGKHKTRRAQREGIKQRAVELLELVGLGEFIEKYPSELSGGMQQRIAIARALLLESSLICMDEPFGALDEFTREQMNLELLTIWSLRGFTGLFVTHNINEAIFLADRVLVMTPRPGRIVADIPVAFERPRHPDMTGSVEFAGLVREVRTALSARPPAMERQRR